MAKTDKQTLKEKVYRKVNELIDGAEIIGSIDYFQLNIKHINGDLAVELINKYKEKIR